MMRKLKSCTKTVSKGPPPLGGRAKQWQTLRGALLASLLIVFTGTISEVSAQVDPVMLHPALAVRTVVTGLTNPTTMAFLGDGDILVLEKNTGKVQRVVDGGITDTVLDLDVNFFSERGLLGIALHPDFPTNPGVYLYWTESTAGADSNNPDATPLLGNRVDRFIWDGSTLKPEQNLIQLRAWQPPNPPIEPGQFGNHDGGVIKFGPDGKLYIFIGDVGRRGQLQNLPCGPTDVCSGEIVPDDQFGGPEPDNAHLTGVILRLNDDGSTPEGNPFFKVGEGMDGEVGANIQKIFSYGHRNSFGMAFDPLSVSGNLWLQENGDDTFAELNRIEPGLNGGWIQIEGPVDRIAQYKFIETGMLPGRPEYRGLQQTRWLPDNIADTPTEALSRLFMLPGAHYSDPELSWKFEVAPAGIGFVNSDGLGRQFQGDLFVGFATTNMREREEVPPAASLGGPLFRFKLTPDRQEIDVHDFRLFDGVADNLDKHGITESESLLIGRDFGIATDIQTGPNGNLFVLSLSRGAIFEIFRRQAAPETD